MWRLADLLAWGAELPTTQPEATTTDSKVAEWASALLGGESASLKATDPQQPQPVQSR